MTHIDVTAWAINRATGVATLQALGVLAREAQRHQALGLMFDTECLFACHGSNPPMLRVGRPRGRRG